MKHLLLTAIVAVVLMGCGNPEANRALLDAAEKGNIEAVKQHLDAGADVNAKDRGGQTPLDLAIQQKKNPKPPNSSANTAARPRRNWHLHDRAITGIACSTTGMAPDAKGMTCDDRRIGHDAKG